MRTQPLATTTPGAHPGFSPRSKLERPLRSYDDFSVQCYVYFRQVEDPTSSRGYYQKSFVLISSSSFNFSNSDELLSLARSIGNKYYIAEESGCGKEVLIDAFHHMSHHHQVRRRSSSSTSLERLHRSSSIVSTSPMHTSHSHTIDTLYSLLPGLWHLWECLITGLPILVYCPGSPDDCSRLVIHLTTLIQPLHYSGDMRPFLSVFDSEYVKFRKPDFPCIVGITSPMALSQLMDNYFLIISTCGESEFPKTIQVASSTYGSMYVSECIASVSSGTRTRVSSLALRLSISPTGDTCPYRLTIPSDAKSVDKRFISEINKDVSMTALINRNIVQQYFETMTLNFLLPFLQFVETDESTIRNYVFSETSRCEKFIRGVFLNSDIVTVGIFTGISKVKIKELYERFIRFGMFEFWLKSCQEKANVDSIVLHAELVVEALTCGGNWLIDSEKQEGQRRARVLAEEIRKQLGDANLGERRVDKLTTALADIELILG